MTHIESKSLDQAAGMVQRRSKIKSLDQAKGMTKVMRMDFMDSL